MHQKGGASEAAPAAVGQAAGRGCRSGWGRVVLVTNAVEAGTWRQGDSGWAQAGRPGGGGRGAGCAAPDPRRGGGGACGTGRHLSPATGGPLGPPAQTEPCVDAGGCAWVKCHATVTKETLNKKKTSSESSQSRVTPVNARLTLPPPCVCRHRSHNATGRAHITAWHAPLAPRSFPTEGPPSPSLPLPPPLPSPPRKQWATPSLGVPHPPPHTPPSPGDA